MRVVLALAICGSTVVACSSDDGDAGLSLPSPDAVGVACDAPEGGTITLSATGDDIGLAGVTRGGYASLGHQIFDPEIVFANEITITVTRGCGHSTSYPSLTIGIPREQIAIGTHPIAPGNASADLRVDCVGCADAIAATGGEIILAGFDPADGSLCGEATLEFPERTVTATFAMRTYCD